MRWRWGLSGGGFQNFPPSRGKRKRDVTGDIQIVFIQFSSDADAIEHDSHCEISRKSQKRLRSCPSRCHGANIGSQPHFRLLPPYETSTSLKIGSSRDQTAVKPFYLRHLMIYFHNK